MSRIKVGVLDFFCGAGGVSAGLRTVDGPSQFEIVEGIDNDRHCAKTFERMIGAPCDTADILSLSNDPARLRSKIEEWALERFDKVLMVGCSPCQGFSAHRKSVTADDPRRNLFEAFCRIANQIKPDAVFMENVPDLFSKGHWAHFHRGRELLEQSGLKVKSGIYNFAGFGLPQERFRAVVIGLREDFELPLAPLGPDEYRTVKEAIGHLPPLVSGQKDRFDPMHMASKHRESTLEILRQIPKDGGNRPIGVGPACLDRTRSRHGGYTDVYGRLAWNRPSVTITARCRTPSCGRFAHPSQDRGLTVREAALLQGFPADYVFEGPFDDGFKQVGNAVSPLVARHMGEFLGEILAGLSPRAIEAGVAPMKIAAPVGPGFAVKIPSIKRRRVSTLAA